MARRSDLSVRLQAARQTKGWTKVSAARRTGLSDQAVAGWESGDVIPNPGTLKLISITYELDHGELVEMRERALGTRSQRKYRKSRNSALGMLLL